MEKKEKKNAKIKEKKMLTRKLIRQPRNKNKTDKQKIEMKIEKEKTNSNVHIFTINVYEYLSISCISVKDSQITFIHQCFQSWFYCSLHQIKIKVN